VHFEHEHERLSPRKSQHERDIEEFQHEHEAVVEARKSVSPASKARRDGGLQYKPNPALVAESVESKETTKFSHSVSIVDARTGKDGFSGGGTGDNDSPSKIETFKAMSKNSMSTIADLAGLKNEETLQQMITCLGVMAGSGWEEAFGQANSVIAMR